MKSAAITLFEGDYHLGAASLINSLHASGFRGSVVCGHRGPPPPWAEAAQRLESSMDVRFVALATKIHLTNYKPTFLQDCWAGLCADADQLYYLDPDIVVKAPWKVLARWARDGVALCEDVNASFPAGHPRRLAWLDFLQRSGLHPMRSLERYYNAGFIGLSHSAVTLLDRWSELISLAAEETQTLATLKNPDPNGIFHTPDQDALNLALLLTDTAINAAGPEAMDFAPGGHLLSHAVGPAKPWRGGFLRRALQGYPSSAATKAFFTFADGPLPVLSPSRLRSLRRELRLAALVGRFYRRA